MNFLRPRNAFDLMFDDLENSWEAMLLNKHDLDEDRENLYLSMEMPGISKENLKIEVNGHNLYVLGENKGKKARRYSKSFSLPNTVNVDKIEADLKDGVLTITVPKIESRAPKLVNIK